MKESKNKFKFKTVIPRRLHVVGFASGTSTRTSYGLRGIIKLRFPCHINPPPQKKLKTRLDWNHLLQTLKKRTTCPSSLKGVQLCLMASVQELELFQIWGRLNHCFCKGYCKWIMGLEWLNAINVTTLGFQVTWMTFIGQPHKTVHCGATARCYGSDST